MPNLKEIDEKGRELYAEEQKELIAKVNAMSDIERDAFFYNMSVGTLDKEDGINCDVCNNKGKIAVIENGFVKIKSCKCMNKRNLYQRFMETGISQEQFKKYQLSTFTTKEDWQKRLLNKVITYLDEIDTTKSWLYMSGISGSGKTHLCTGIVSKLINKGFEVKYFVWNTEISGLIALKKSFYEDRQQEYSQALKSLKNCQILYIDDFLQLDTDKEALSIAYEIINSRYTDSNKITIISSEVKRDDLYKVSKAIAGRIFEKAKNGEYAITIDGDDKNYRLKGE